MTPTTEAVIPVSAADSAVLWRSPSTWGAPRKMNRKQGMKVTQVTRSEASTPATHGSRLPGWL